MTPKTALVLAGGGMFGAYQAGVWKALAPHFRPDLVVGASIGAINGWAIAGGCDPDSWIHQWLHMEQAERHRWRFPWPPLSGMVDAAPFEEFVQQVHTRYQPRVPFAAALTALPNLRPQVVATHQHDVTWRHLAASCAVFGIMPQYKIGNTWYTDGGLLGALPAWAAIQLGATRLVCVNILPKATGWLRAAQHAMRRIARHRPELRPAQSELEVFTIEHPEPLGPARDSVYWSRARAETMIGHGRRDAELLLPRIIRTEAQPTDPRGLP